MIHIECDNQTALFFCQKLDEFIVLLYTYIFLFDSQELCVLGVKLQMLLIMLQHLVLIVDCFATSLEYICDIIHVCLVLLCYFDMQIYEASDGQNPIIIDWNLNRNLNRFSDSICTIKIQFQLVRFDLKKI